MESVVGVFAEECQQDCDGRPRKCKLSSTTSKPDLVVGYPSRAGATSGASDRWASRQHSSTQS
eukprot:8523706-Lingulodinium_polyedra.AAC.1